MEGAVVAARHEHADVAGTALVECVAVAGVRPDVAAVAGHGVGARGGAEERGGGCGEEVGELHCGWLDWTDMLVGFGGGKWIAYVLREVSGEETGVWLLRVVGKVGYGRGSRFISLFSAPFQGSVGGEDEDMTGRGIDSMELLM